MALWISSGKGEVQIMQFWKLSGKFHFLLQFCTRNWSETFLFNGYKFKYLSLSEIQLLVPFKHTKLNKNKMHFRKARVGHCHHYHAASHAKNYFWNRSTQTDALVIPCAPRVFIIASLNVSCLAKIPVYTPGPSHCKQTRLIPLMLDARHSHLSKAQRKRTWMCKISLPKLKLNKTPLIKN